MGEVVGSMFDESMSEFGELDGAGLEVLVVVAMGMGMGDGKKQARKTDGFYIRHHTLTQQAMMLNIPPNSKSKQTKHLTPHREKNPSSTKDNFKLFKEQGIIDFHSIFPLFFWFVLRNLAQDAVDIIHQIHPYSHLAALIPFPYPYLHNYSPDGL